MPSPARAPRVGKPSARPRISTPELLRQARRRFGVRALWPGQAELIQHALEGRDAIGILPTGGGKSLCYQLPALWLEGLVVVVSPLIALMQDQHEHLTDADIEAARLDSTISKKEVKRQEAAIGKGQHRIVLLTPERLASAENLKPLKRQGVALFVVDEAHCVSTWGHDFRPAYLELRRAIRELGSPPVLALTATAPPERLEDILTQLGIPDANVIQASIDRDNLTFEVIPTVNEAEKEQRLLSLLDAVEGSVIVYAATVRQVNQLHEWLNGAGHLAERYHGRLNASQRERAQRNFMTNGTRVMVATNAFGLGIDKPDVRAVVHWNFPDSLESYYQEAGRAGRDGEDARCVLFYRLEDRGIRRFFLAGKHPHEQELLTLLRVLREHAPGEGLPLARLMEKTSLSERRLRVIGAELDKRHLLSKRRDAWSLSRPLDDLGAAAFVANFEKNAEADALRLRAMTDYAESARCRVQFLREYFGELPGAPCRRCDSCRKPIRRPTRVVKRARPVAAARAAAADAPAYATGQTVRHARFGRGAIEEVHGEEVTVRFERFGQRRVLASYLR